MDIEASMALLKSKLKAQRENDVVRTLELVKEALIKMKAEAEASVQASWEARLDGKGEGAHHCRCLNVSAVGENAASGAGREEDFVPSKEKHTMQTDTLASVKTEIYTFINKALNNLNLAVFHREPPKLKQVNSANHVDERSIVLL